MFSRVVNGARLRMCARCFTSGTLSSGFDPATKQDLSSLIATINSIQTPSQQGTKSNRLLGDPQPFGGPNEFFPEEITRVPSPIDDIISYYVHLHDILPLPWWGTILVSSAIIRLLFVPMLIANRQFFLKLKHISPQLDEARDAILSSDKKTRKILKKEFKKKQKELYKLAGIQQWKQFCTLISAPFYVGQLIALRKMCMEIGDPYGLTTGGAPWIADLTVMDPYYILPITFLALSYYRSFIRHRNQGAETLPGRIALYMELAVLTVVTTIVASRPAALSILLVSGTFDGVVGEKILAKNSVRTKLGIPEIEQEEAKRYAESLKRKILEAKENIIKESGPLYYELQQKRKHEEEAYEKELNLKLLALKAENERKLQQIDERNAKLAKERQEQYNYPPPSRSTSNEFDKLRNKINRPICYKNSNKNNKK